VTLQQEARDLTELHRQSGLFAVDRHVARARELVNETGYGRREREVKWLEGTLG
jgi:hypothetical protein